MLRSVGILSLLVIALGLQADEESAAKKPQKQQVSIEDLGTTIEIVGRLGLPLHTLATFDGHWERPNSDKDDSLYFLVTKVNEHTLPEGVKIHLVDVVDSEDKRVEPAEGESWSLRGYETGFFMTAPATYEIKQNQLGLVARSRWGRFCTSKVRGILQNQTKAVKGK
jgi:hypothetical protein